MCGDEKSYTFPTKATRCWSCSNKTRKEESVTGCTRVCIDCKKTSLLKTPSAVAKAPRCMSCSSKHRAKTTPMPTKGVRKHVEGEVRHFRLCPDCGGCIQVGQKTYAGYKLCRPCLNKSKREKTKANPKKYKSRYVPVGTDGAKRNKVTVKFQIVDPETMEAPVKKRKKDEYPQSTPEQEAEMIATFLKKRDKC